MHNVTKVNLLKEDGTISRYCEYVNDFTPEYNMVSLCIELHKRTGDILNTKVREQFREKIRMTERSVSFEMPNGDGYITRVKPSREFSHACAVITDNRTIAFQTNDFTKESLDIILAAARKHKDVEIATTMKNRDECTHICTQSRDVAYEIAEVIDTEAEKKENFSLMMEHLDKFVNEELCKK